jgi:hypothetical protein
MKLITMEKKAWMHGFLLVLVTFLSVFFYFFWMDKVKPWPDVDAMLSFYYPVKLWFANTGDFFADVKLFQELRPGYPPGLCFIFAIFEAVGFGRLVLDSPHILMVVPILCLTLGATCFYTKGWNKVLCLALLSLFPLSLILFRSQTPHAFTSVFAWLSCLLFHRYLVTEDKRILVPAGLFLCLSAGIKHTGAVHGVTILFSLILSYQEWRKLSVKKSILAVFILLGVALLFYPMGMDYAKLSANHNPMMSSSEIMFNGLVYLILLYVSPWFFRKKKDSKVSMKKFFCIEVFAVLLLLNVGLAVIPRDMMADGAVAVFIGLGSSIYAFGFYRARVYENSADGWLGLMLLLSHAVATWFFLLRVGHIFHLFWLELALFICLSIRLNAKGWLGVSGLFLMLSTLFPRYSYLRLQEIDGGFGHRLYQKLFNGTYVNLLGIRNNGFDEIRQKYRRQIWDIKDEPRDIKGVVVEVDFYLASAFREYLIRGHIVNRAHFPIYERNEFDLSEDSMEQPDFFLVGDSLLNEYEKDSASRDDLNLSIDYKQKYLFERLKSSGVIESKYCKTDLSFDGRSLTLYRNNVLYDCTLITFR